MAGTVETGTDRIVFVAGDEAKQRAEPVMPFRRDLPRNLCDRLRRKRRREDKAPAARTECLELGAGEVDHPLRFVLGKQLFQRRAVPPTK